MRVLLINSTCGRQSTGRIVTGIKRELVKQGHECVIAYGEADSIADADDYHIGSELDRYIHAGLSRIFDDTGFHSTSATEKFIKWVKEYNPDVIHLHNIHGYYINIEVLFNYLRICGKKIIWTLHDCWSFTGHCAYFDYVGCDKWKNGCEHCPQKSEYPARIGPDMSRKNYKLKKRLFTGIPNMILVTPSKWLSNLVSESYMREYSTEVIYNGIDTSVFKPTKNNIAEKYNCQNKRIVLGVASVWDRRKGLSSFAELSKKLEDLYQIILVGLSKEQEKKLPDNIIGIERTNSVQELAELYSAAFVFVNPTLEDNYPTTNLEAIACGTPVITFDTGGSPESASLFGCIVNKGDVKGIMESIYKVPSIRNKYERCNNFGTAEMIKKYIQLYENHAK